MLPTLFVTELQTSAVAEVGEAAFHDIALLAQAASVGRTARRQFADDAHALNRSNRPGKAVATVCKNRVRLGPLATTAVRDRGHHLQQRHQLSLLADVGRGDSYRQRQPGRIGQQVPFAPVFSAIDRTRPGMRPPKTARTLWASATAWSSFTLPSRPRARTKRSWTSIHTPALVQSRRRRQQVEPLTPKASVGRVCHASPARNIKIMPRRQSRSSTYG